MPAAPSPVLFVLSIAAALFFGLALETEALRLACRMLRLPAPPFGRAMAVVILQLWVTGLANQFISIIIYSLLGVGDQALAVSYQGTSSPEAAMARGIALLLQIPVDLLIGAALFQATLEKVSFGNGILLWILHMLVWIALLLLVAIPLGFLLVFLLQK